MSEMYAAYIEGGGLRAIQDWPKERNPFESGMQDWLIGSCKIGFKQLLTVTKLSHTTILENLKGANEGILKVSLELMMDGVDDMLSMSMNAAQLIGKELKIKVTVHSVTGLRWTKGGVYCTYYILNSDENDFPGSSLRHKTKIIDASASSIDDVFIYTIPKFTDFLNQNFGTFELLVDAYGEYDEKTLQANKFKSMKRRARATSNPEGTNQAIGNALPIPNKRAQTADSVNEAQLMASIQSLGSLERLENERQQDLEEVDVFRRILDQSKEVNDETKKRILEEVKKFRKKRKLKPQLEKALNKKGSGSMPTSPPPERADDDEAADATKILLDKIEDAVTSANSKDANKKLKETIIQELEAVSAELPSTSPELEDKVRKRRTLENLIFELRVIKEEEQGYKAKTFEILDKCSSPNEVDKIKAELVEQSKMQTSDIDPKKDAMAMIQGFCQSVTKRHDVIRGFVSRHIHWVNDETHIAKFVPFANLPDVTKTAKQDAALAVLKSFNSVNDKCKKAESILMGQISLLIDRGNHHYDESDGQLMLKREQMRMMDVSGKAVGMTIDAISAAETRMKEQAENMEKLKKMVSQQAVRGAYLENYSKNQGKDLGLLKQEITRLNGLLSTRDEEHKKENKQILEQLVEKSKKLGEEMITNTKLRSEIVQLKAEIVQMKELLKGEENIRTTLLNSQGNAAMDELVELQKNTAKQVADLKKELEVIKSHSSTKEHDQALKEVAYELKRLESTQPEQSMMAAVAAAGSIKTAPNGDAAANGNGHAASPSSKTAKVHPEGVEPSGQAAAGVDGKSKKCTIM